MPTLVEQILGGKSGETVLAPVDLIITDDWTTVSLQKELEVLEGRVASIDHNADLVLMYDHAFDSSKYSGGDAEKVTRNLKINEDFSSKYNPTIIRGKGIQHHTLPELGYVKPGMVIVGNDSHTCTQGAYGAYAKAVQPIAVAVAMKTGKIPITIPETIGVEVVGELRDGVSTRDAMLYLLKILSDGHPTPRKSTGKVIEYFGDGLEKLDLVSSTIFTNMSSEASAATAIFPVTERLKNYLKDRGIESFPEYTQDMLSYSETLKLDLSDVVPVISRNGNPADVVSVSDLDGTKLDQVFVGTCSGGKYDDIKDFWGQVKGNKVKTKTIMFPASSEIMDRCEKEGILNDLRDAGVEVMWSGCGPCYGFGPGRMDSGQVTLSTGNRNYIGRMGDKTTQVLLASGVTAGASAVAGVVTNKYASGVSLDFNESDDSSLNMITPQNGNVWVFPDDISTDDITPSSVPGVGTTSDTDESTLKKLAFHYSNPEFRERSKDGDFIVAGYNFGKGSNRASSVTALKYSGIKAVIAKSVAPIYSEGALFNGLPTLIVNDEEFYKSLNEDSEIEVDFVGGKVLLGERGYSFSPLSKLATQILNEGGIVPLLEKQGGWV